jgi:hypothetical protein
MAEAVDRVAMVLLFGRYVVEGLRSWVYVVQVGGVFEGKCVDRSVAVVWNTGRMLAGRAIYVAWSGGQRDDIYSLSQCAGVNGTRQPGCAMWIAIDTGLPDPFTAKPNH